MSLKLSTVYLVELFKKSDCGTMRVEIDAVQFNNLRFADDSLSDSEKDLKRMIWDVSLKIKIK